MGNPQLGKLLALALTALLSVSDVACDHRTFSRKQLEANGKDVGDDPVTSVRREKVKDAMLHAWTSYEKYAWGLDQLQPQTMNGVDTFGGFGVTIVDALDTLFIMGLDEQFKRARE